jgi:hypothetical protein
MKSRKWTRLGLAVLGFTVTMMVLEALPVADRGSNFLIPAVYAQQQTGPQNRCYGDIVAGIASTWPWAADHESFPPPPGALALWIQLFLPGVTVRDLQLAFCTPN